MEALCKQMGKCVYLQILEHIFQPLIGKASRCWGSGTVTYCNQMGIFGEQLQDWHLTVLWSSVYQDDIPLTFHSWSPILLQLDLQHCFGLERRPSNLCLFTGMSEVLEARNPWIWNLLSSQKLLDFPDVWDKRANKKKEIILSKDDSNILERQTIIIIIA